MPRRVRDLEWSDDALEKIGRRGLTEQDALAVLDNAPQILDQPRKDEPTPDGFMRIRPARLRMIGPGRSNRILTFIIELPDEDGVSALVTGWPSGKSEIAKYRQAK